MYYLFDRSRNQFITSTIRLRNGGYAIYYGSTSCGARWATEKGANKCIERLENAGSLPADHSVSVVYVECA